MERELRNKYAKKGYKKNGIVNREERNGRVVLLLNVYIIQMLPNRKLRHEKWEPYKIVKMLNVYKMQCRGCYYSGGYMKNQPYNGRTVKVLFATLLTLGSFSLHLFTIFILHVFAFTRVESSL